VECLSPFKNLWLESEDYLRVLGNLQHYMECDLIFLEYACDNHSKAHYPVMKLDDVKVYCNHDTDSEAAAEKWNRRRKKINYDNILIEMSTEDPDIMERFLALPQYEKKICFVPFETDKENAYQLYSYPGQSEFWEPVISNVLYGPNSIAYNLLNLLIGKNPKR
jgi:uncharacterized protein (DUF1919 family)